jgi:predicted permease
VSGPGGFRRLFRTGAYDAETREELDFHLACTVEELTASGMTREEAEWEAHRRFGDEARYRRELGRRESWHQRRLRLGAVWDTVRTAARRIRRTPGTSAAVVATFAVGIGANATMFGIVDRILLSPPAHVADAETVKRISVTRYVQGFDAEHTSTVVGYPDYTALLTARSFSEVAAFAPREMTLGEGEGARPVRVLHATPSLFPLLGTRPYAGRFFLPEEDAAGAEGVVVLGHALWREQFGGDPEVLGSTVELGHGPLTVVGIAPPGFTGADLRRVDAIIPITATAYATGQSTCVETLMCYWVAIVARLAPGVAPATAAAEATVLHRAGRAEDANYDTEARVSLPHLIAARGDEAGAEAAVAKWLTGIALLVLLIASANIANLLLARGVRQRRETAIRMALGGSRAGVVGIALAESLMLGLLGGLAALALAVWGGAVLRGALLPEVDWSGGVAGWRTMGVVLALALASAVLAGALPALQAGRDRLSATLKSGGRGASGARSPLRATLTVAQAALSVLLLVGAGLFVLSMQRVRDRDMGMELPGVAVVQTHYAHGAERTPRAEFIERAVERLRGLPMVEEATAASFPPLMSASALSIRVPGLDSIPRLPGGGPYYVAAEPEYLRVMGHRVVRGRAIGPEDVEGSAPVLLVTETTARTLWPGEEAVGQCITVLRGEGERPCREVVGVLRDFPRFNLVEEEPAMMIVLPADQMEGMGRQSLVVRLRPGTDRVAAAALLRDELRRMEPALRAVTLRSLDEHVAPQLRPWRLGATMFSIFGALALVVASIGLYSMLAFGVAQRTLELGIRAALGATRGRLLRMVVREGVGLTLAGVAIGSLAAVVLAPRIQHLLFQVDAREPAVLLGVAATILLVGGAAALLPALAATRADPAEPLRAD